MSEHKSKLLDFMKENPKNVLYLKNAKQVEKDKKHIIMVGSETCGYTKMQTPMINMVCDDLKETKCFIADLNDPESAKAITDLGINDVQYFPTNLFNAGDGKGYDKAIGMHDMKKLSKKIKDMNFK